MFRPRRHVDGWLVEFPDAYQRGRNPVLCRWCGQRLRVAVVTTPDGQYPTWRCLGGPDRPGCDHPKGRLP